MEEEDSTEQQAVGSPAPGNVKEVHAPESEDDHVDTPDKESLNDETLGTAVDTSKEDQERIDEIHGVDLEIGTSSKGNLAHSETNGSATDIEIRGQEEDIASSNNTSTSSNKLSIAENSVNCRAAELDIQKKDAEDNSTNDITVHSNAEEGETLNRAKDNENMDSFETIVFEDQSPPQTEETNGVQKEAQEEVSMQMKSKDVSSSGSEEGSERTDDNSNSQQGRIENSVSEEEDTGKMKRHLEDTLPKKEKEPVSGQTEQSEGEANISAWPERAAAITNFVRAKSIFAVSNVLRRFSGKSDGQNDGEVSKDINNNNQNSKEVSSSSERDVQEADKSGWNPLSFIGISNDKAELKEETVRPLEPIAIKGRIILYTKLGCQECKQARLFLHKKRLRYCEINLGMYPGRKLELEKMAGSSDVPRVLFNDQLVGGLNDLKVLEESGKMEEKIEYITTHGPSFQTPIPPYSGEDDLSSIDELAVIVRKMQESIVVRDSFYKFRRVTNCFLGSEAVDFISDDQYLEREEAIEFTRKLAKQLFFQHVFEENTFEDGNHLYRFLDQDPVISQCQNIPRGISQLKTKPLVETSFRLRFLLCAILEAYASEDGRHVDYRTIHGSEEFARYLRIAESLQRIELNKTAKEERLAFFINLYNLMAIHAILVWGHPDGALDRRKLLNDFKYVIGGCAYSLSDIHNGILRANQRPPYTLVRPFSVSDKRFKVALPYAEPLIHFALVCGNRSGPALRCYSPRNIDSELVEAARDFLRNGALVLDLETLTLSVSKILQWYSVDFGKNEVEVMKHAANYLEPENSQTLLDLLDTTPLKVIYQPYDWGLNS